MLSALLLAFAQGHELSLDYRDDDDGRALAEVVARAEGRRIEIVIRAYGLRVEPSRGFEGFRGENLQTSRELERAGNDITATTDGARLQGWSAPRRGAFRARLEEPARLAERTTESSRVREVVYWAELEATAGPRPFTTVVSSSGVPRLALRGVVDGEEVRLIAFEARPFAPRRVQETDEALIRRLADDSADVRREAEATLRARGLAALPALERHAEAENLELRGRVRQLLRDIRLDDLVRRAADGDPEARARALDDVGRSEGKDPLKALAERPDRRFAAALTDVLVFELDSDRRKGATSALRAVGPPEAFPGLLWALRFPGGHLDEEAKWFASNGDATVLGELERLDRLGYAGATNALALVRARVGRDASPPAAWAPVDEAPLRRSVVDGPTPAARIRGLRAVVTGLSRDPVAVDAAVRALGDSDADVRFRAVEVFTWVQSKEAVEPLAVLLRDAGTALKTRQMAAVALGRHSAAKPLLEAFAGTARDLRLTIAGALGDAGGYALREQIAPLHAAEQDRDVREALRRAMTLGSPSAR